MVLSADDIAAISHVVAAAIAQMGQHAGAAQPPVASHMRKIDERNYRKIEPFNGTNWKDFAFQFKAATRSSSDDVYEAMCWAEQEVTEVDPRTYQEMTDEDAVRASGELFNLLTLYLSGEPLQMMHNCNFNGLEAWRRLAKRYSPSTPLRAMQLMLQIISPERTKELKNVQAHIDRWEAKVLALERDFRETLSERMKSAILISTLPNEIRDAILQQPEKFELYQPTKERVVTMVEAKLAIKSPDEMDVDGVTAHEDCHHEDVQAVGKGGIYCFRCGGQGHIAAKCATPEPPKGKGKGGQKGGGKDSKGKGKGGKGEWTGYCSYCGKRGHGPKDCWTRQKDEEGGDQRRSGGLASVEEDDRSRGGDYDDINGFDIANLDVDMSKKAMPDCNMVDKGREKVNKGRITIDSGAAESVIPPDMLEEVPIQESAGSRSGLYYIAANGGKMPNVGEKHVRFRTKEGLVSSVLFQVTAARKPLASVSKIVRKGNKVVFAPDSSYIENIASGQRMNIVEDRGTYHLDVDFLTEGFGRQA